MGGKLKPVTVVDGIANEEWIVVSSGRDRHTGNRTRWRSDTSIFRGSFSPVATLLYHPVTPLHSPDRRFVFKTVPETKSRLSLFSLPPRRPYGTQSFQKPSRRTETHATSHCLIGGVVSFFSGLLFSFHLAPLYYLTKRVFPSLKPSQQIPRPSPYKHTMYAHAALTCRTQRVTIVYGFA